MNTQAVVNFLVTLGSSLSSYTFPVEAAPHIKGEHITVVTSKDGEIIDFGPDKKLLLERFNPSAINTHIIGIITTQGVVLTDVLSNLLSQTSVNPAVLLDFSNSTKLQLINMANQLIKNKAPASEDKAQASKDKTSETQNPQTFEDFLTQLLGPEFAKMAKQEQVSMYQQQGAKTSPDVNGESQEQFADSFQELFSQLFGPELAQATQEEMEMGCEGCPGCQDLPDVNWDEKLFNGVGEVKYKRTEGDQEKGYRTVKMTHDGLTMKYPVDGKTGMPIFEGMDPEVYAVDNASLDEESADEPASNQMESIAEQLKSAFPDKKNEIGELLTKLTQ